MQTLNDPNASLEQKQQAQQVLVNNIAAQMKVDPAVVLQAMITDEKNEATKGGYINGGNTLYVNGDMHDTLQDEANTVGHEMQHYLDDKAGTTAGNATEDFLGFNYGNLTDTTFGGDINHTASTNAPGSGVLLDTNTNQFNHAKEQGELENRMPPNAFGVDWSNMDSGGIQAQNDSDKAVAHVDSVMKDNGLTAPAIIDYLTIGFGGADCVAGTKAGCAAASIAFSDLGQVLSTGIEGVKPIEQDFIQGHLILPLIAPLVKNNEDKAIAISEVILGVSSLPKLSPSNIGDKLDAIKTSTDLIGASNNFEEARKGFVK
ncbi:hypothetical protein LZT04_09540 [Vibrio fluvialis]|nr:hypothetical protein [Vibrio fluvialis]